MGNSLFFEGKENACRKMKDVLQIFTHKIPNLKIAPLAEPGQNDCMSVDASLNLGGRDCFMSDLKWKTMKQRREGEEFLDRIDTKVVSRSAGIKMPRGKEMLNPLKVFVGSSCRGDSDLGRSDTPDTV